MILIPCPVCQEYNLTQARNCASCGVTLSKCDQTPVTPVSPAKKNGNTAWET